MTQKFEDFRTALVALCREHKVALFSNKCVDVWDVEEGSYSDDIRLVDETKETHDIYKDGDENIPDCVKDRNGQVVLGLCKKCGKAECELDEPCGPREVAG